jgi:hypothetical protein
VRAAPQAHDGSSALVGRNRAGSAPVVEEVAPADCYLSAIVKVSLIGVDVPLVFWARIVAV